MEANALPTHRKFRIVTEPPAARHSKRVDLVITDCHLPGDTGGREGVRQEFRCTIPLAILADNVSTETLHDVMRVCQPGPADPVGAEEFLRFVIRMVGSLHGTLADPLHDHQDDETASQNDRARVERLTSRERQVLRHIVAGHPNKTTAASLNISRRTVEHHRAAIMQKTRTRSVSELVRLALRTGLSDTAELTDD